MHAAWLGSDIVGCSQWLDELGSFIWIHTHDKMIITTTGEGAIKAIPTVWLAFVAFYVTFSIAVLAPE